MSGVKHQPATPLPWIARRCRLGLLGNHIVSESGQGRYGRVTETVHRDDDAEFIAHACTNYQFLVRVLKAELAEHERWSPDAITGDKASYHRERAGGIRALLNSMGEL